MLRLLVVASLIGLSSAACGFPNGTDTKLNWWQGATTAKVTFTTVDAVDASGNSVYPISLTQPLTVKTHLDNEQGVFSAPNLRMDIKLYEYGGLVGCSWSSVPTFGLLSNMDACTQGVPCPVAVGDQDLTMVIDFTQFASIISLLSNDSPYQIELKLSDKTSNTYVTIMAQARCLTK